MTTYYGFKIANHSAEPAWFHTEEAARRFAAVCGWEKDDFTIEQTTTKPDENAIMDTAETPWSL